MGIARGLDRLLAGVACVLHLMQGFAYFGA
jgi:hypothetical protein